MNTHAEIIIGHVHLTVANLDRSLSFYCGLIGLQKGGRSGDRTTLLPGAHHSIVLDPPHKEAMRETCLRYGGVYRFSFLYPNRKELARVIRRFITVAYEIDGIFDYGPTQALYLRDPDGIPVELYVECTEIMTHKKSAGLSAFDIKSIDLESLLARLK